MMQWFGAGTQAIPPLSLEATPSSANPSQKRRPGSEVKSRSIPLNQAWTPRKALGPLSSPIREIFEFIRLTLHVSREKKQCC